MRRDQKIQVIVVDQETGEQFIFKGYTLEQAQTAANNFSRRVLWKQQAGK